MVGGSDTIYTGNVITAEQFNDLVSRYELLWRGDIYEFDENHNTTNDNRRYGWGQASIYPKVNQYTIITAEQYNHLVTQINAGLYHIDEELFLTSEEFRMTKRNVGTPIAAEYYTKIRTLIAEKITPKSIEVDSFTVDLSVVETNSSGLTWTSAAYVEHKFEFPDYNTARHFFNSGGKLTIDLSVLNINDMVSTLWQAALDEMSTIYIGATSTNESGIVNAPIRKGFYNINPDGSYTSIFEAMICNPSTYSGYSGYSGYDSYCGYGGYGGYSERMLRIYARGSEDVNGFNLSVKIELVEPVTTDPVLITSSYNLASGYLLPEETPDITDPNISYFTENTTNTVYQFERRFTPLIYQLTNWYIL